MLTNKQKYDYYVKTYNRVESGWRKGGLGSEYGGACLVGAINYAVSGRENGARADWWDEDFSTKHTTASSTSNELQIELATEILPAKKRFLLAPKPITIDDVPRTLAPDGGLSVIESWNDKSERRKDDVLAVIQKRIDYYAPLVRDEEIERLQALVADLRSELADARARITELEKKVAELQSENLFMRKSKTSWTATQLRSESEALRDLDDQLDAALSELQGYGVTV